MGGKRTARSSLVLPQRLPVKNNILVAFGILKI
jgi:hypothetical protein